MIHQLDEQQALVARTVREFVEREVLPVASDMEHRNEYPHALVETMKSLGLFGLNVPEGVVLRDQSGTLLYATPNRTRPAACRR